MALEEFLGMAVHQITFDIHCVTSWTRFDSSFTGMPLATLLDIARPQESARFVSFESYSKHDHHTSLPMPVAESESWLVHSFEGEPLEVEHGGPVRVVTPGRYFYKSLKWVRRVVALEEDRTGWWETNSAYHNNAEPWSGSERFESGSLRPQQLTRFLQASSYDKYRGRVLLGLDLKRWRPSSGDLRRLYLKNCDLRDVDLTGADLRDSNLSLSDLRGAILRGADLSGSDLEGANFAGSDLTDANLTATALTAARFFDETGEAILNGARFEAAWGLTESQEDFVWR